MSAPSFSFAEELPTPSTPRPAVERPLTIEVVRDRAHLVKMLAHLAHFDEVGLDCEATGKDPVAATPLLLQVGTTEHVWVVVLPRFEHEDLKRVWQLLKLQTVVGHNLNYDYRLLKSHYDEVEWPSVYDTQVAEAMLTAGDFVSKDQWLKEGLALKVLVAKYLHEEMSKEARLTFTEVTPEEVPNWDPTPEQVHYAALDVADTMRVAERQVDDLNNEGMLQAATIRMRAVVPMANVELRGMRIDVDAWRAFIAGLEEERAGIEALLIARLDRYEQQFRIQEFQQQTRDLAAWETAYEAEQERLKALWQMTSTSASAPSCAVAAPLPTCSTKTAASTWTPRPSATTSVSSTRGPLPAPSVPSTKSPPSLPDPSSSGSTASTSNSVKSWGRFKTEQLALWRTQHPRPPKPSYDSTPIKLRSTKQLQRVYSALGIHTDKVNKEARSQLLRSPSLSPQAREVLNLQGEYSRLSTLISSFGESILKRLDPLGRLHTSYNIGLTDTGRMSSEKPNFQNFPRRNELRHCFLADPGYLVVTADFKSQELAIGAGRSQDPQMCADLREGKDLYKQLAVEVYDLSDETQVTAEQRTVCKTGLLGIAYGLTPKGMEKKNGIAQDIGSKVIEAIKKRYPVFFAWLEGNARLAVTRGYVITELGAKRYFRTPGTDEWQVMNQGRNQPVQGTGAEVIYVTARRLEDNLVPFGILPVNYVHDEVVSLVPADWAEEAAEMIVHEMQEAFLEVLPFDRYGLRCGVDVHLAPYWTKE